MDYSSPRGTLPVFSFVKEVFLVLSLDSFLPDPLKYGVRFLVGWKIFIPSRGEFDYDSFKLPAVFLFELFCLGVFS